MLLLPLHQPGTNILSPGHRLVPQRLLVPCSEPPELVRTRTGTLVELEHAPHIRLEVLAVLAVDCVRFTLGAGGIEEGGDEELGEAVESWDQGGRVDIEAAHVVSTRWELGVGYVLVTRLVHAREGVRGPRVLRQELCVVVLLGILHPDRVSSSAPRCTAQGPTFSVPMNMRCSQKCARPCKSSGSLR